MIFLTDYKRLLPIVLLALWIVGVSALFSPRTAPDPSKAVPDTLSRILEAGEITLITQNNANCYYTYRDMEMGFEFDLARAFAEYLGVKLKVNISEKWEGMIPGLLNHSGDFIGAGFTITEKRGEKVDFSDDYMSVQQYMVVHRTSSIQSTADLAGKSVHVRRGTSYQEQLEKLKRSGIDLHLVLHEDLPTDELIRRVAEKQIEVTIADSNIALLNRRYYPQVVMVGPISEKQYLGWAVNPNAPALREKIDQFFKTVKENGVFEKIYNKYYKDIDRFDYVDLKTYHRRLRTRLPRYTETIKAAAGRFGFDWRLIAAQMYQESHFNPLARSHAGASGLMQLTHPTAISLGVNQVLHPVENVHAGVQHLKNLYDHFDDYRGFDRLKITLAAYNIGQGHVWDAKRLAVSMGLDPQKWSSLAKTLPLLRYKKYYKYSKYGYCRGTEPVKYVNQVLLYYDILRRQAIEDMPEDPLVQAQVDS